MKRLVICLFAAGLLSACQTDSTPAARRAPAAKPDPQALVAAVRAAGEHGVELEVAPLRDPHVEDLLAIAESHEAAGRVREAQAALDQALAITPQAPDLIQWKAELAMLRKAWAEAETLANQSWELGPRLGGLCRRNWATIQHSRGSRGDAAGAEVARRQVDACTVAPPVRM